MNTRILLALLVTGLTAHAEIRLPAIIGDHMVLQQDAYPNIWGWSTPGKTVKVTIDDQVHHTISDENGSWLVTLDSLPTGAPLTMDIVGDGSRLQVTDILVGEVWIGSGQSNMQWTVENSANSKAEIAQGNYPSIRLFYVPRKVADTPQSDVDAEWTLCTSDTVAGFSAVLYYFGRELNMKLGVPMGLIHTSWGGTPAESWASAESLEDKPIVEPILKRWDKIVADYPKAQAAHKKALAAYQKALNEADKAGTQKPRRPGAPRGPDHPHRPSSLFNAMIYPLIPYTFQGAIWYQGESNASRAYQYSKLFPTMIQDWRDQWGGKDFPFLFVQLANYQARNDEPVDSAWAELREAQRLTLSMNNTGMAVIIDIGEADDIHPKNKQDVGKRLALDALANTYGRFNAFSGPTLDWVRVKEDRIVLKFENTEGGLHAQGGDPVGFSIAGEDQKFVWADAEIKGDKVVLSAKGVPNPVAARYGWANNPACNLYNGVGLPTSPFRTDDWAWTTKDNL